MDAVACAPIAYAADVSFLMGGGRVVGWGSHCVRHALQIVSDVTQDISSVARDDVVPGAWFAPRAGHWMHQTQKPTIFSLILAFFV